MDQLIVALMDSCDNNIENTDDAQDLNPNECDTNDTKVTHIVNTKCSGIVVHLSAKILITLTKPRVT